MAMTMRERIARAFKTKFYDGCGFDIRDPKECSLDDEELGRWKALNDAMDAVLAEFETPTDEMVEESAKKIFAHRAPEHREWGDFAYEQSEYRVCASAAFAAAIRVAREGK